MFSLGVCKRMYRTGGLFFRMLGIILLVFVLSVCGDYEERCTTPYSQTGTCVGFNRCEELKKKFFGMGTTSLTIEARELLKNYTCGFIGKKPMVCCPDEFVSHQPERERFVSGEKREKIGITPFIDTKSDEKDDSHMQSHSDDHYTDEHDQQGSFERKTSAEDSPVDYDEESPGNIQQRSSFGQIYPQAAGHRNPTGSVSRNGPRIKAIQSPPPNPVNRHKNFRLLPRKCGKIGSNNRISNGNKTGIYEFPWMALIAYNTKFGLRFSCSGTIINKWYILTAAHCVTDLGLDSIAGLRVGEHDFSKDRDCEGAVGFEYCAPPFQDFVPDVIIPHPRYGGRGKKGARSRLQHDIALVRLDLPIDLKRDNAKAICLPTTPELQQMNLDGQKLLVAGWGVTESKTTSPDLLKVNLLVVRNDVCQKIYSGSNTDGVSFRQMCAGGMGNVDSCAGDSGGPLKLETKMGKKYVFVQHGIVSYGPTPCGSQGSPGVYTRLAYYMDWILDNIKP